MALFGRMASEQEMTNIYLKRILTQLELQNVIYAADFTVRVLSEQHKLGAITTAEYKEKLVSIVYKYSEDFHRVQQ